MPYPIHLKPKDDELLSSWIVRLASAHGMSLVDMGRVFKPALKSNLWMLRDIDLGTKDAVFNALITELSSACAIPPARARETTLAEFEGHLYERLPSKKTYTWILPYNLGGSQSGHRLGTQACSLCLAEDDKPYFRRRWRLAFVVACPRHKSVLLDSCPGCNDDIRFHLNASGQVNVKRAEMMACRNCRFDLRMAPSQQPAETEVIEFQEHLVATAERGYIEIEGIDNIASPDYFAMLHWMLSVVIQPHKLLNSLRESIFAYYDLDLNISLLTKKNALETLGVTARYELVWLLHRMLKDHPDRYLRDTSPYQPMTPANLMDRLWYSKCLRSPAWFLPMMYAERDRQRVSCRNQIDVKQSDAVSPFRTRPERINDVGDYGDRTINPHFFDKTINGRRKKQQNYPDVYKQTAQALFSDGFSPHDAARILDVSPRIVAVWIESYSGEGQTERGQVE